MRSRKLAAILFSFSTVLAACAHADMPANLPPPGASPTPAVSPMPSPISSIAPSPLPTEAIVTEPVRPARSYPAIVSPQGPRQKKVKAPTPLHPTAPETHASPVVAKSKSLSQVPQVLQDLEVKYVLAVTLQAEFTQVNEIAALKTKKTSSGVLMVKRPDKLRWETLKPDMNLLVSDGRHFWFYTPPFDEGEHGQVIEKKSSEINSKLANALLSGRFSAAGDMKIRQESSSKFLLVPKAGTAGTVSRAEIEIDPDQGLIRKVTLEHKGGNRSEITLSKIELGKKIGDDAFVFEAPPGTDKVE